MNDNNMNNGFNNVNPNPNFNSVNDINQNNNNSINNQMNNINSNNGFWNNEVNQNNMNNIGYNQGMSNSIENVNSNFNNNVNNINNINQVQGVNPQMNNVNQVQEVNPQVNNVIQDMVMSQQVNSNVVSNQDMNNNQNINVAESFLNVIKENTNDNVMISNSIDMNNNSLGSSEAVSDTFNMNNIDVSQINNSIQNDVNNVNQVQDVNPQVNNVIQDMGMNQQVNNVVDNQNVIPNTANVNDSFGNVNMVNNSVNSVDNNVNQNLMVDNNNQVNNQSVNNDINSNVDEELVRAYVGEKYDKIKNSSFSLPTFFLGSLYLFYRKMYLYGWLMMLLGPLSFIGFIILAIKFKDVYLKDVSKKVNKIKLKNSNLSNEELKNICSKKGGTSIGGVLLNTFIMFLLIFVMLVILIVPIIMMKFKNDSLEIKPPIDNGQDVIMDDSFMDDGILLSDASISGYGCFGDVCDITINDGTETNDYSFNARNVELFKKLRDYKDYLKVDIYYTENGEEKTIIGYKVFVKSSNEDISNIKNEDELRTKLGLYTLGTHTVNLILKKIGMLGAGFNENNESYSYITYTFVDDKNSEYEMDYKNPDQTMQLVEGNKYNVTFEVVEGMFDYEYEIKSIK